MLGTIHVLRCLLSLQTPWQDTNSSQFFVCMKVPCCFCFHSFRGRSRSWWASIARSFWDETCTRLWLMDGMMPIGSLVALWPGLPSPGWQTLCFRPCDWWDGCCKVPWFGSWVGPGGDSSPPKSGEACGELWARAWWNSNDWWLRRDLGLLMKFKLILWIEETRFPMACRAFGMPVTVQVHLSRRSKGLGPLPSVRTA